MVTTSPIERVFLGSPRSIRRGLFPLAFLGLAAIGIVIYELQQRGIVLLLLLACIGAVGLLVVIRPAIGLAAVVMSAALVRLKIGTGTDSPLVASLVMALALVAAWFVHQALHRQPMNLLPRWVFAAGMLLAGATWFSLLWGRVTLDPRIVYPAYFIRVQLAAAALTSVSIGLLFVGADLLRGRQARSALTVAFLGIGFLALPFRVLAIGVPLLNSAGLFGIWFVSLCWAHALANRRLPDWTRVLLGLGAVSWLLMAVTVEGNWVSGWLPAFFALSVVTLIVRPRLGVALVITGIVAVAAYNSVFYSMLVSEQQQEGSLGGEFGRLELWRRNLAVIDGRYTFGTGPAGYALYYVTFVPDKAMSTHSNYVDTLAQYGFPGLIGLLGLLTSLWLAGARVYRRLSNDSDRAACAAVVGGIPAVAFALWLGDWLIPFVYNQTIAGFDHSVYSWLMLAMLCGIIAQQRGATRVAPTHA